METISGYVDSIIFTNEENSFTVAKIKEECKKEFTIISGIIPSLRPGEKLICEGEWIIHPSYGRQFQVKECSIKAPSDLIGIHKYLESGLVKGIGKIYAKKIVDKFGIDTLKIIDESPDKLRKVAGIGKKRLNKILECWESQKTIREVIIFLRSFGVSPAYAQKIYKKYGNLAIQKVRENPYQLAKEVFGIGFKIADAIAEKIGIKKDSDLRIKAGVEYVLWELSNTGHTCYPQEKLENIAAKTLEVDIALIRPIIKEMVGNEIVTDKGFIWLKSLYLFEKGIADEIFRILGGSSSLRPVIVDKAIEWVEGIMHIKLAKEQKEAVINGINKKMHIITGGPGTGKSTITKAILKITEKLTDKIILAAPTGRAAKRLFQITGKRASTIHMLLEFDFINGNFKKNGENPLKCNLLIIDEASMIDTLLMHHLLIAVPDSARVIFVGDVDQLPSVGPGNVLKDLISSQVIGITRLREIYRQAAGSKIISNAHKINNGFMPDFENEKASDFYYLEKETPEEIEASILALMQNKSLHFHPIDEVQVLSPMKKGKIGTENLNLALQNALNPSKRPLLRSGKRIHLGDKVMQIRNNYTKMVFNGDVGRICKIDEVEELLYVNFDDKRVEYDFAELDEIVLAYAVSIHKYQGSECPCVIIPMHTSHFKLLYRNLLYTAVTRGKKRVIVIGTKKAIACAVRNEDANRRYTGLEDKLRNLTSRL